MLVSCLHAGADAFMLEALFRNEAWGFMLQPVSQENEKAVCQSMVDGCRCHTTVTRVCTSALHTRTALDVAAQRSSLLMFFVRLTRHRQALEAYPTTIDEDLALLGDAAAAPQGSPARTAIQVRCSFFMHAHLTPSRHEVPLLQAGCP